MELEYRFKIGGGYPHNEGVTEWLPLPSISTTPFGWDFRFEEEYLDLFEIREKPSFVPGYFIYTDPDHIAPGLKKSAHWFDDDPGKDYARVDVTLAD
jgi:hypothetical protein